MFFLYVASEYPKEKVACGVAHGLLPFPLLLAALSILKQHILASFGSCDWHTYMLAIHHVHLV